MKGARKYIEQSIRVKKELQRSFIIVIILTLLLAIISLVIGFKYIELEIKYEELNQEKQALKEITKMQDSMIVDLEENCKDLFVEIENEKFKEEK